MVRWELPRALSIHPPSTAGSTALAVGVAREAGRTWTYTLGELTCGKAGISPKSFGASRPPEGARAHSPCLQLAARGPAAFDLRCGIVSCAI